MRKIATLLSILLLSSFFVIAQDKAPKSPAGTASNSYASVEYSRPFKNDRVIFGGLVPYGEVWRTGANMSTDITFKNDVKVAGKKLKAGTYAIFTIPTEKEWTVIFNSVPKQRGASEYDKNKKKNVLEVKAPVTKADHVHEQFTIHLTDAALSFEWDNVLVTLPISK